MRSGRYESSEGSNIGTAITFLLIGLGAGALGWTFARSQDRQADAPRSAARLRRRQGYTSATGLTKPRTVCAMSSDRVRDVASRGADFADELRERAEPLRHAIKRS